MWVASISFSAFSLLSPLWLSLPPNKAAPHSLSSLFCTRSSTIKSPRLVLFLSPLKSMVSRQQREWTRSVGQNYSIPDSLATGRHNTSSTSPDLLLLCACQSAYRSLRHGRPSRGSWLAVLGPIAIDEVVHVSPWIHGPPSYGSWRNWAPMTSLSPCTTPISPNPAWPFLDPFCDVVFKIHTLSIFFLILDANRISNYSWCSCTTFGHTLCYFLLFLTFFSCTHVFSRKRITSFLFHVTCIQRLHRFDFLLLPWCISLSLTN